MKFKLFVAVIVAAPLLAQAGQYYEFQGPVTSLKDYSPDKILQTKYADMQARYVVYIDTTLKGWWLSGSTGKQIYTTDFPSTKNYYAQYVCGNALNKSYFGNVFYNLEQKSSASTTYSHIAVGQRIGIDVDVLAGKLAVGDIAQGTEHYGVTGQTTSFAKSDLTLIATYENNPCN